MRAARCVGLAVLLAAPASLFAQDQYRDPPPAIAAILDAKPTPSLSLSPRRDWFVLSDRRGLPSIAEVAEPHLKLAGSRINPNTNGTAGTGGFEGFTLQRVRGGEQRPVQVPAGGRLSSPDWSPDGTRFTFTQATDRGIALYLGDTTGAVRQLHPATLNGTHGAPCQWLDHGTELLCAAIPAGRGAAPQPPAAPTGPAIQESEGRSAPERTYQDLLTSPFDEALFAHYFTTQNVIVGIDGRVTPLGAPGLTLSVNPSPDAQWFIVTTYREPFSYQVPWSRFRRAPRCGIGAVAKCASSRMCRRWK